MNLDIYLFSQINNLALKYLWLDTLGIFLAKYLPWVLIGILILFLIKDFRKYWKMVSLGVLAAGFARIITEIIRLVYYHPRPFIENEVNLLLNHPLTSSFPSWHTSFFFAFSTVIYFYNKKAGFFFFLASFLIGFGRVFTGIHWPSDILGGMVLGILSAWLINKLLSKF